jgi:hypothetical protein
MINNGNQQSFYMHKVFPNCYLVAGMGPCSKSGSVFIFDLPSGMQGTVWYRYSLFGFADTLQSVDKVLYSYDISFSNKDTEGHYRRFYLTNISVRY